MPDRRGVVRDYVAISNSGQGDYHHVEAVHECQALDEHTKYHIEKQIEKEEQSDGDQDKIFCRLSMRSPAFELLQQREYGRSQSSR